MEELLMVAAKRNAAQRRGWRLQQMFENATGIASAIDIVTEENDQRGRRVVPQIGKDFPLRLQQQVEAAMHVANGIDRKGGRLVAKVNSAPPPVVAGGWLFTTANPVEHLGHSCRYCLSRTRSRALKAAVALPAKAALTRRFCGERIPVLMVERYGALNRQPKCLPSERAAQPETVF